MVDLEPDDLGVTDEFIRQNYDVDDLKLTGIDPSVKEIKKLILKINFNMLSTNEYTYFL